MQWAAGQTAEPNGLNSFEETHVNPGCDIQAKVKVKVPFSNIYLFVGGGAPLKPPIPNRKLFSLRLKKSVIAMSSKGGTSLIHSLWGGTAPLPPPCYALESDIFVKFSSLHVPFYVVRLRCYCVSTTAV